VYATLNKTKRILEEGHLKKKHSFEAGIMALEKVLM
jgi:hypothetical protein